MKKQLVYVSGKSPGREESIISEYLESYFGFFRTCPSEIEGNGEKERCYGGMHSVSYHQIAFLQALMESKKALKEGKNVVLDEWIDLHLWPHYDSRNIKRRFIETFEEDDLERSLIIISVKPEVSFKRFLESSKNSKYPIIPSEDDRFKNFKQKRIENLRNYCKEKPYLVEFQSAGFNILNYDYNTEAELRRIKRDLGQRFADLKLKTPVDNRKMTAEYGFSHPSYEWIKALKTD